MASLEKPRIAYCKFRKPITVTKLPYICRLYRKPYRRDASKFRQFAFSLPMLAIIKICQILNLPFKGSFQVSTAAGKKTVIFNALNTQFSAIYFPVYEAGYEPELAMFMDTILGENDTFVDVGSNWGYFPIWVCSNSNFQGEVIAFEPFPSTFQDLDKTVHQCGFEKRISCQPFALSDHDGSASMVFPDHVQSGQATLGRIEVNKIAGGVQVQTKTLDSIGIQRIDLIKIDAEGHEEQVLKGGINTLTHLKPFIIFENGRSLVDLENTLKPMRILENIGYVFFEPCWYRKLSDQGFFIADVPPSIGADGESLALFPLTLRDRLMRDGINIIACHKDRLEQLNRKFKVID